MLKNGHGNEIAFYDQKMHEEKQMSVMIESSRQEALENGEFHLYLQAKKDLRTGRISGAEALVRWIRKDGTMIYPDRFIPVFEKDGFCAQLDLHMVELVCEMQRTWLDMGMEIFPISVNQSKLLFYQEDYIDRLCEITDRCGIPRKYLVLEITGRPGGREPGRTEPHDFPVERAGLPDLHGRLRQRVFFPEYSVGT